MSVAGRSIDESTRTGCRILAWSGRPDAHGDAVPLRLAGALHALVRRGELPDLAGLYPPNALPSDGELAEALFGAINIADDAIYTWLDYTPQTNEVARSAYFYPALMMIAAETGFPLKLFEVGASAGLNLIPDRYAYVLGEKRTGDPQSTVVLKPDWVGPDPVGVIPKISSRRGCDLNPLSVHDPAHCERLGAYVWPDQPERLIRLEAALSLAAQMDIQVDCADASQWIDRHLSEKGPDGQTRVIFHSIATQYFPEDSRAAFEGAICEAGARSTSRTPLAWLSLEQANDGAGPELRLCLWPSGSTRTIARGDAHAKSIEWKFADPE